MKAILSISMAKLLALLLVLLPLMLSIEAYGSSPGMQQHHLRMMRRRLEARSLASFLTKISSKASDWVFGSVPNPNTSPKRVPKPQVGGVPVLPKMPYPYATCMIPRLASEILSGGGLPGGWMCLHVTPPLEHDKAAQTGAGAGASAGAAVGAGLGGGNGEFGAGGLGLGFGGGAGVSNGAGGMGGTGPGVGAGAETGLGVGAGGLGGGFAGGQLGGVGAGAGSAGAGLGTTGGAGAGAGLIGAGAGPAGGQQGLGAGGYVGTGAGTGVGGMVAGAGTGAGLGNGIYSAGAGDAGDAGGAGGAGVGDGAGLGAAVGSGLGASAGVGTGAGAGAGSVPAGYIRYNGQLLTINQYQQALANSGTGSSLSRRDLFQPETSNILLNTFIHKRQAGADDSGAGQPSDDSVADNGDATVSTPKRKTPAKVLMCINGDPAVPAIKFDTMTGLRIREASDKQDGVVAITNLPRYNTPWMPFLPTAEMWSEQQTLMLAQEEIIEKNMTTGPPPSTK